MGQMYGYRLLFRESGEIMRAFAQLDVADRIAELRSNCLTTVCELHSTVVAKPLLVYQVMAPVPLGIPEAGDPRKTGA